MLSVISFKLFVELSDWIKWRTLVRALEVEGTKLLNGIYVYVEYTLFTSFSMWRTTVAFLSCWHANFWTSVSEDLAGVKILHGLDKVVEGGAVVLTLKDQNILANGDINDGTLYLQYIVVYFIDLFIN